MRVAIYLVLISICTAAAGVSAAPLLEASVSYPNSVVARNAAAAQDAIKPSALQQKRAASSAMAAKAASAPHVEADAFDRRLASLDPSQIVYGQSQLQAAATQANLLDLSNGRLLPRQEQRQPPRQQHARSAGDFLLMGFAALMLIAYQLRRKHRFLRPHPFSY